MSAKLRANDEEVEKLVAQQTQELKQEHQDALYALPPDDAGKLKEAVDGAEAAAAAKYELAGKVEKLGLEELRKEIMTLTKLLRQDRPHLGRFAGRHLGQD